MAGAQNKKVAQLSADTKDVHDPSYRSQRVSDATGATPITYQPDYLDPLGRSVRVSIRKLFF